MLIALALLTFQATTTELPILSPGYNSNLTSTIARIEDRLQGGDFDGAKGAFASLPKLHLKYSWDDSAVPANRRAEFKEARDLALRFWHQAFPGLTIEPGIPSDISYSFKATLPVSKGSGLPAGAVHMLSSSDRPL